MNPYLAFNLGIGAACVLQLLWAVIQPTRRWRKKPRLGQQAAAALREGQVVSIQQSHGPQGTETVIHLAVRSRRTIDRITVWGER